MVFCCLSSAKAEAEAKRARASTESERGKAWAGGFTLDRQGFCSLWRGSWNGFTFPAARGSIAADCGVWGSAPRFYLSLNKLSVNRPQFARALPAIQSASNRLAERRRFCAI